MSPCVYGFLSIENEHSDQLLLSRSSPKALPRLILLSEEQGGPGPRGLRPLGGNLQSPGDGHGQTPRSRPDRHASKRGRGCSGGITCSQIFAEGIYPGQKIDYK